MYTQHSSSVIMEDALAASTDQDLLTMELPPNTVLVEPSDDFSEIEAIAQSAVRDDIVQTENAVCSTPPPDSASEPKSVIVGQTLGKSLTLDGKLGESAPNPTEDRGWLHRDLMTNTAVVPLSLNSNPNVQTCTEMASEEVTQADISSGLGIDANGIRNLPPPHTAVVQPLDEGPSSLGTHAAKTQGKEGSPSVDDCDITDQVLNKGVTSKPPAVDPMIEQGGDSQQPSKGGSTPLTAKTSNMTAKKNRLLDILNARAKDLSVGAKKDPQFNKPSRFVGSGDSVDSVDSELPSNTAATNSASSTPEIEPMEISEGDSVQSDTKNEQNVIINKPVTQIMGTSKRKAKKPLPKRSSLESMIVAASDPTDFFSIANTLDDGGEEVLLVDEPMDQTSSQITDASEETQVQEDSTLQNTLQTVKSVPTSPVCTTSGVAGQFNTVTISQPSSSVAANTIQTFVNLPPNPQTPTPQTSLALQQTIQSSPPNQLPQHTHYVQQVLQPQQPQLSLLQQKLMQPIQQGSLLPQGQILVQGNIMQGSILQTSLTSVDGVQQAVSTSNLILQQQQQQPPQQYIPIQQVPMGQSVIQQTAVLPPVYQGNVPIIQQQTAQPIPPQQANSTIFAYSSTTPTVVKPQQTVFLLQRSDMLKLDNLGNLIVIGKEEGNSSQVPVVQPGSSVLTVSAVKQLLSSHQPTGALATQELVPQPRTVAASSGAQHQIVTVTRTVPSKSTVMQMNPPISTQAAVTSFNRPVVLGKQPVASVPPQRQKSMCPNPELELIRSGSINTGTGSTTTTITEHTGDGKVKMGFVATSSATANASKGGIKIFQCEKCKKLFVSKASLFNHLAAEMHTNNQPIHVKLPYKCNTCEARFAFKASLTFHTSRPSCFPEKPGFNIICSHCKLRFKALIDLERHVVRCHHLLPSQNPEFVGQDPEEKREKAVVTDSPEIPSKAVTPMAPTPGKNTTSDKWQVAYKTEVQPRNVQPQETLDEKPPIKLIMSMKRKRKGKHRGRKHKDTFADPSDASGQGIIKVLKDEDANTRNIINMHGQFLNKSPRPFSCKICSKGFTSEHCLLEHIKTHIKPFSCSKCGWKSARKDNVLKHIQLQHGGPKYQQKRQGKHRKDTTPSPVTSENEADDLECTGVEDAQLNIGEDDLSDAEDPDIELDEDDQPHDYFGSRKFDGPDDKGDKDDAGGSGNKDNSMDSDRHTDRDVPDGQDDDDGDGTTTPAPQDHNYLMQKEINTDSTRPPSMENESSESKDDRVLNSGEPTTVSGSGDDIGATSPGFEQSKKLCQRSSQSAAEKRVPLDPPERDGLIQQQDIKDCHTICKETDCVCQGEKDVNNAIDDSTEPYQNRLLKVHVACSSAHSDTKNCAEVSDLDECTNTTSEVNNKRGSEKPCTEGHRAENVPHAALKGEGVNIPEHVSMCQKEKNAESDGSSGTEHFYLDLSKRRRELQDKVPSGDDSASVAHISTERDNCKESRDKDGLQTCSVSQQKEPLQQKEHANEGTHNCKTMLEITSADSRNTSLENRCADMLDGTDVISDGDMDWSSEHDGTNEESALPEDDSPKRLILLRDEEGDQMNTTENSDDSVFIDDDNLEIRLNDIQVPIDKGNIDHDDDSSDIVSNSYYTVLNAEGSDGDEPQEECSVMDEDVDPTVDSGESENVARQLIETLEMECQKDEDESRQMDPSQVHAKCNVDPEVRVKTEDLSENSVPNVSISRACRPGSSQKHLNQKVIHVAENVNVSEYQVRKSSREILIPEKHVDENSENLYSHQPEKHKKFPSRSAVRVKEEIIELHKGDGRDTQYSKEHDFEDLTNCDKRQTAAVHLGGDPQMADASHGTRQQSKKRGNFLFGQEAVNPFSGQSQVAPSLDLCSTEGPSHANKSSLESSKQVLPVITAVGSLQEPGNNIEGVNQQRKSVILDSLNRPSQPFPSSAQPFGPTSPGYDPRVMYNSMGLPMADSLPGQQFLPRYPHPGNPYMSMFHSGAMVDPREQCYPGHSAIPATPVMGCSHRLPLMGPSLSESRFPRPNGFPPQATNRRECYPHQQEQSGVDKHYSVHQDNYSQFDPHKLSKWGKQKNRHLRRHFPDRQQTDYQHRPSPGLASQPSFSPVSPGSSHVERFMFPKHSFEERVGGHMAMMSSSDQFYQANGARHLYQDLNPSDLSIVSRAHEYGEIAKQPVHLEQNITYGPLPQSTGPPSIPGGLSSIPTDPPLIPNRPSIPSGGPSIPNVPPSITSRPSYAHVPHIPARQQGPAEASIPVRPPAPLLRPCLPGSANPTCINIGEPVPDRGMNMARQMSHELQNGNDKPPPLVYQGPQKPQNLSSQKNVEKEQGGLIVKEIPVEDSSQKDAYQKSGEVWSDSGSTGQFPECVQNNAVLQEATFPRNGTQLYAKPPPPPPPPPVPAPPPPPPALPALHSSFSSQPGRLQYNLEESLSERNSQPPQAHQHHSPADYVAGANAPFGPAPIHVGPPHVSPILPNQTVPSSPLKGHTSSGPTDQQSAPRRRKKSLRSEENPEDRPYACHICGSRFKRSNNLTDHVRIHSRPYKCGECNFDTTRWQYLADHLKKNHNFEGDAKELEVMFKSGKRLKPTDHIPETCYQPIRAETNDDITTGHPIRNGFSPGSRSMVVPTSTLLPRGTDIVHRDRSRKRKHHGDEDPDEDLVDFFGHSSNQDDEDATVAPITVSEVEAKDDLDDAASGSANGAQISPGSAEAQTSPKGSPITSPKPEATWSKRKQLMPVKVTDDALVKNELDSEIQTNEETVVETDKTNKEYELMINEMEKQIRKEDVKDVKQLEDHEEAIAAEPSQQENVADHIQDSETEVEKEGGDESDQECSPTCPVSPTVHNTTDESDEDVLFTPTGRPKRRASINSLSPRERRHSENEDPEYKPNRSNSWKKRSLKLKIHIKRSKKRGRPKKRPVSDSSNTQVEALSTHVGGGLDLSPYYAIVDTNDEDLDRRPYECRIDKCKKRFKSKQHMREHLFTHLKPYKCDGCGIGFARTDYLAMHMRDMHKMSPTRAELYNKRKCANGRAMACRMRPSKDRRRQELQQSFQNGKEL